MASASVRVVAPRRPKRSDRALPMVYGAVALVVAMLILPSVLRPPQDQPQTSSAFSPDAPPDKNQSSLFSSFRAAGSGTSAGIPPEQAAAVEAATTTTTEPPPKLVPRDCAYGFGNPARQIESVYAPPCAPAFTGNNGGTTAAGVTADSINVCYLMELTGTVSADGEMPQAHDPSESANMRTYKVLRDYFNTRYQFYGRQLRFFYATNDSSQSGEAQKRARADKAADTHHCFAAIHETNPSESDELAKKGIIHTTMAQTPEKWFGEHDPFLWSFTPSGSQDIRLGAEYACKKLAHKPPSFTDDPTFAGVKERKFGAIVYNLPAYDNPGPQIKSLMAQCGVDIDPIVTYDLTGGQEGTAGLASAVAAMRAARVTTIFYLGDLISSVIFTQNAKANSYFPEWFIPGFGGVDTGHIARDYDQDEWQHAFGFSLYEIPKPDEETECYKAYHEIDPNNDPDSGMCTYMWGDMVQLFGAMQNAGPRLTPAAMKQAFLDQKHLPPDPPWHMAGGYDPNDHTYPDWAAEIWWDPNAMGSDGQKGTYRFVRSGQRYTYGQWPTEDPMVFQDLPDSVALRADDGTRAMSRRGTWTAVLVVAALVAGACGLGDRQALEDRVVGAEERLERAGTVDAVLAARVVRVKSDKPAVPGPPKIVPARISEVPAVIDLRSGRAAVGVRDGDPSTAVLLFVGSDLYQRIAPKTQSSGVPALTGAATNLQALVAAYQGITLSQDTGQPPEPVASTTTTAPSALRRAARIPRQWIAFDYSAIDEKDPTKKAGSYAINPPALLRLAGGVLTGSIERQADADTGLVRYDANVNRDKAERRLDEGDRKLLDKVFRANAIDGRTYPARIWLDRDGNLRRFEVTMRQSLTNVDRADLRVTIEITGPAKAASIPRPDPKATATVATLGQLVTAVTGA